MAYSGEIRFILETNTRALVKETPPGALEFDAHKLINADFTGKSVNDTISYTYDSYNPENNGRDVTLI